MRWALGLLVVVLVLVLGWVFWRPVPTRDPDPIRSQPKRLWVFEATERGALLAGPCVTADSIFVAAIHDRGFRSLGAVYALDPATGKPRWTFHADHRMIGSASMPVVHGSRVYVGEGLHASHACRLYSLDAATGSQHWSFETTDHIEGSAVIVDDIAYFGSGNDGVYAVRAESGQRVWQTDIDLHIDTTPCVVGDWVLVGSGPSRRFPTQAVVALDRKTGRELWRRPTDLPAWGSPRVAAGRVYVGLANGRLNEAAAQPAGALLCLSLDEGRVLWRVDTRDAVFQPPTLTPDRVLFGSREGTLTAVDPVHGQVLYRVPVGGPIIAPFAIRDEEVVVATTTGLVKGFDLVEGRELWSYDLREGQPVQVLVYGAVQVAAGRVYVAAEVKTGAGSVASLMCLQP